MAVVGGYSLHLYCDSGHKRHEGGWFDIDSYEKFPAEYAAEGKDGYSKTRIMARRDGWILHKDGTATCPLCNPKLKSLTTDNK